MEITCQSTAYRPGERDAGKVTTSTFLSVGSVATSETVTFLPSGPVIWALENADSIPSENWSRSSRGAALTVVSAAVGVAFGAAKLFDVSFALGAFFAGMVMSSSTLSQQAMRETLPLRDAFAVLFFVSVGMLFDPHVLIEQPLAIAAAFLIIIIGKSIGAWMIVRVFGYPNETALTIAVALAQIGEFSFILAGVGVSIGALSEEARNLILASAMLSMVANPMLFAALDRWIAGREPQIRASAEAQMKVTADDSLPDRALKGRARRASSSIRGSRGM